MKITKTSRVNLFGLSVFFVLMVCLTLTFQNCSGGFTPVAGGLSNQASVSSASGANSVAIGGGGKSSVVLQWAQPFTGVPEGYTIEQSIDGTNFIDALTVTGSATTATISGLAPGAHYFRIRAYTPAGRSNDTQAVMAVIPAS